MGYLSTNRRILFIILVLLILFIPTPSCSAQDENTQILNEISQEWSTNLILIFVETPNKFDRTYGINVTHKAVLDEMSSIEEAMDPKKDDFGEDDDISSVLSISTLIKEIYLAPKNIAQAVSEELDIQEDPIDVGGDYIIPEEQDEIDRIVDQIPADIKKLLVKDTNDDGIWDSAGIIMGVHQDVLQEIIMSDLYNLIDKYYIDTDAEIGDYNSKDEWWKRIESGDIHCAMTPLGYVKSYEYYEESTFLDLWFPIVIIVILVGLLIILLLIIKPKKPKKNDEAKTKKKILPIVIIFLVLIGACFPFFFIETSASKPIKLTQYSEEFNGGQVGMVLIRGNPAPQAKDEPTKGSGSMKDIEVLDAIYYMEEELITLEDEYPPINPSMCIVDIMEMIKVPESMVVRIPLDILTPEARQRVDYFINTSFWDVIHMAEDNTTSTWSLRYGKSMQDSMINIFYNSITLEMRSIFVNRDYSKSLIYIQIPMVNEGNTEEIISSINNVINHHSAFISTTNVALVESETGLIQSIVVVLKAMALLIIIIIGVIAFVLFLSEIQKGNKKGKQEPQVFWPEESYPMRGYPPKR